MKNNLFFSQNGPWDFSQIPLEMVAVNHTHKKIKVWYHQTSLKSLISMDFVKSFPSGTTTPLDFDLSSIWTIMAFSTDLSIICM